MPRIIGAVSVQIIRENFKIQSYDTGNGTTKWQPRKYETNKAYGGSFTHGLSRIQNNTRAKQYRGSVYSASKPLLMQSLNLYNSIAYKILGKRVFIGLNLSIVPYARAHNEGLNHEPVRQFMPRPSQGANVKMLTAIRKKVDFETQKALRAFKK